MFPVYNSLDKPTLGNVVSLSVIILIIISKQCFSSIGRSCNQDSFWQEQEFFSFKVQAQIYLTLLYSFQLTNPTLPYCLHLLPLFLV
jgi:hypothetical protein